VRLLDRQASILLREADKPAIVDVPGIYAALADGDRVRLDAATGTVARAAPGRASEG